MADNTQNFELPEKLQNVEDTIFPRRYVHCFSAFWDLYFGEHPKNVDNQLFYKIPALFKSEDERKTIDKLDVPLIPCIDGHNTMADATYTSATIGDIKVPISPLFARDLSGRVICLGYGPEIKDDNQWLQDRRVTFPKNADVITDAVPGADLIENVIFTRFRALDVSTTFQSIPSGREDLQYAAFYGEPNLYPYKMRMDSFYQDGWRLPQTEMLFARQDIEPNAAEAAAQEFLSRWQEKPADQSYEDFYEANGGEGWF